jgi:predicted N-formylglutamate amidohydrolase
MTQLFPASFSVERSTGASAILLTCDHASHAIPPQLAGLGLSAAELLSHVAWDSGAVEVASGISQLLDATLIYQNYSRLIIDCNRPPGSPQSVLTLSETTRIPGNEQLSTADREQRLQSVFWPYHERIISELDQRASANRATMLVSMHSFTPVFHGVRRPWHAGLLYQRDARLAHALLPRLRAEPSLVIGDNEPYSVHDETDYTLIVHGERRGIPHVGIELRQDLIADAAGQTTWAKRLAPMLAEVYQELSKA